MSEDRPPVVAGAAKAYTAPIGADPTDRSLWRDLGNAVTFPDLTFPDQDLERVRASMNALAKGLTIEFQIAAAKMRAIMRLFTGAVAEEVEAQRAYERAIHTEYHRRRRARRRRKH